MSSEWCRPQKACHPYADACGGLGSVLSEAVILTLLLHAASHRFQALTHALVGMTWEASWNDMGSRALT